MTRTGRRPGDAGTRDAILAAARTLFAASGFERTTIRAIARRAAVDPALVHHYFGSKDGLLRAALQLPVDVVAVLAEQLTSTETVGPDLARAVLTAWEAPEVRERLVGMLRTAVSHDQAAELLRTVLIRDALAPLARRAGSDAPELRAELVGSHLAGLAIARHVLRIEPIASAPLEQVVAAVGPTFQRYLTAANVFDTTHDARTS
jgi:AcrR family transcriptional regulator